MVPDFALRLQSMTRALREVIIPAIPASQRLALDQASILLGNLKIMAEQQDRVAEYLAVELDEYARLVRVLLASAGVETAPAVVKAAVRASAALAAAPAIPAYRQSQLAQAVKELKQAADDLLNAAHSDGTAAFQREAEAAVMGQSAAQVLRERVWFGAAGFELDPDRLPALDEVLRVS